MFSSRTARTGHKQPHSATPPHPDATMLDINLLREDKGGDPVRPPPPDPGAPIHSGRNIFSPSDD